MGDDSGDTASNSLGPKSTAVLIVVVFGSTIFFFGVTAVATIRGSQKTPGAVGALARGCFNVCGKRCGSWEEDDGDEDEEEQDEYPAEMLDDGEGEA